MKLKTKAIILTILILDVILVQSQSTLSKATLLDKIKGGWAGQTIGVTFGGPVEFRYNGTMIQTYHPIPDILIYSDTQAPTENVYQFGRIPKK